MLGEHTDATHAQYTPERGSSHSSSASWAQDAKLNLAAADNLAFISLVKPGGRD